MTNNATALRNIRRSRRWYSFYSIYITSIYVTLCNKKTKLNFKEKTWENKDYLNILANLIIDEFYSYLNSFKLRYN